MRLCRYSSVIRPTVDRYVPPGRDGPKSGMPQNPPPLTTKPSTNALLAAERASTGQAASAQQNGKRFGATFASIVKPAAPSREQFAVQVKKDIRGAKQLIDEQERRSKISEFKKFSDSVRIPALISGPISGDAKKTSEEKSAKPIQSTAKFQTEPSKVNAQSNANITTSTQIAPPKRPSSRQSDKSSKISEPSNEAAANEAAAKKSTFSFNAAASEFQPSFTPAATVITGNRCKKGGYKGRQKEDYGPGRNGSLTQMVAKATWNRRTIHLMIRIVSDL